MNASNVAKGPPLSLACQDGHLEVVALLLTDTRIDINMLEVDKCSSLWFASQFGHLAIVRLLLASGRDIDTQTKSVACTVSWANQSAAEIARFQRARARSTGESPKKLRQSEARWPR